jgi:hypothetical protein
MISIRKHQGGAFLEVLRLLQEMTPPSSSAGTQDDGRKMNECKKEKKSVRKTAKVLYEID